MRHAGYVVVEHCDDYEQILGIKRGDALPSGGILEWTDGPRAMFPSRSAARKAIDRTEHYRLAFGTNSHERKLCRIDPIIAEPEPAK